MQRTTMTRDGALHGTLRSISPSMSTCDVLIVGGGPAGSTCAWKLRQAGLDVVVLDKAAFPRDKVCAGWITPAVVDELKLDLDEYRVSQPLAPHPQPLSPCGGEGSSQSRTLQPITRFLTGVIGGGEVETKYDQPMSYGIRRCEFDHYLLSRSGARLQLGESLRNLRLENGEWIVNDTYHARLVVGAGGHFCPVARFTAPDADDGAPVVLAQEIEFEMTAAQRDACRVEPDRPELFFCRDLLGYGWVFRKRDFLNIGLGREREQNLSAHVADFCEFLKQRGRVPGDISSRFHGHAYRLLRPSPRPVRHEQLLLIGDAAGLAYPQSGEGIRPAIESGLLAAQVIFDARGDYRGDLQSKLRAGFVERFGADRSSSNWTDRLPTRLKQSLAAFLLTTRWFSRHVLLNRWFLHRQQDPLV